MKQETLAALDLGSNSFHLQVGRVVDDQVYLLDSLRDPVRLGAGLTRDRRIDQATKTRALEALARFAERLRGFPRSAVRAVGTSALRVAKNADSFLAEAEATLGFPIEVIFGREEARLIYLGVAHSLAPSPEKRLVIDIGGGSTELVAGGPEGVRWHDSLDIGSVRLTERFLKSDPPTAEELDACAEAVRALLADRVPGEIRGDTQAMIGVAGTITSLAALALGLEEHDGDRVHGSKLTADALEEQFDRLASVPLAGRRQMRPLDPDRAPVIVGGAVIAREVLSFFGLQVLEISERDILDGAALAAVELPKEEEGAAPPGAYTCC